MIWSLCDSIYFFFLLFHSLYRKIKLIFSLKFSNTFNIISFTWNLNEDSFGNWKHVSNIRNMELLIGQSKNPVNNFSYCKHCKIFIFGVTFFALFIPGLVLSLSFVALSLSLNSGSLFVLILIVYFRGDFLFMFLARKLIHLKCLRFVPPASLSACISV